VDWRSGRGSDPTYRFDERHPSDPSSDYNPTGWRHSIMAIRDFASAINLRIDMINTTHKMPTMHVWANVISIACTVALSRCCHGFILCIVCMDCCFRPTKRQKIFHENWNKDNQTLHSSLHSSDDMQLRVSKLETQYARLHSDLELAKTLISQMSFRFGIITH
jgi:hypothetical protein